MLTEMLISGERWPTARAAPSWPAWPTVPKPSGSWRPGSRLRDQLDTYWHRALAGYADAVEEQDKEA
jgi:hypothetical protein